MSELATIGLDNTAFRGNLRQWKRRDDERPLDGFCRPAVVSQPVIAAPPPVALPMREQDIGEIAALPAPKQIQDYGRIKRFAWPSKYTRLQMGLLAAAGIIFAGGLAISARQFSFNHQEIANASAMLSQNGTSNPSTSTPSAEDIRSYSVAPDLARYLNIPELGVHARVIRVGVTTGGALATPGNIFDTGWYSASAKPGQPGATVIDGHVSSWTREGVFSGIKNLRPGDNIQIVRGNDSIIKYKVVRTAIYDANSVDMQSAVAPVTAGKSGLNLITCTGKVIKGTNDFSQRLVVYASQA